MKDDDLLEGSLVFSPLLLELELKRGVDMGRGVWIGAGRVWIGGKGDTYLSVSTGE